MVIFRNIIGFDGLIFILAGVNIYIMIMARKAANDLYESMHQRIYAPAVLNDLSSVHEGMTELTDQKISALREAAVSKYTLYINLTAIFPLMGILGTVISLLGMVGDTSDIEGGFFAALTSTFWGLVFAITFKFLDGFIDDQMEMTEELVDKIDKHKTVTEKVINDELRTYGTVDRFSQSTEKWLAKTQSDSSRNQPAQLIDKAYNAIDSIDTNIFLKLSDEQLGVVIDKLDKLSNIIEQVRSELDV